MLTAILQETLDHIPVDDRSLLDEITVLVATETPRVLLDGRTKYAWDQLLDQTPPQERADWTPEQWERRLAHFSTCVHDAPNRLFVLYQTLVNRRDFPHLSSLAKGNQARWRRLIESVGADPSLAGCITSLFLAREEFPASPRLRVTYERVGFAVTEEGRPARRALFPEDLVRAKWKLAQLATERCGPAVVPGSDVCSECPIRMLCRSYRDAQVNPKEDGPTFVDLFAGGGGLSLGLSNAGLRLRLAVEMDQYAADTLFVNHDEVPGDVVDVRDINTVLDDPAFSRKFRGVDVVAGGPPCQPFSMARRHSRADTTDDRRDLFLSFVAVARRLRPRIVVMENVPGILNADSGRTAERVEQEFARAGFLVRHALLNAADFGVAQNRQRVFFIGARRDAFPHPDAVVSAIFARIEDQKIPQHVPLKAALSGLPELDPGEGGLVVRKTRKGARSFYAKEHESNDGIVYNHEARGHNDRDIEIFSELKPGETAESYNARRPGRIPYQLDSFGDKYRKLHPDKPSPTIPAHLRRDANSFVHPEAPRGITAREAARIQSFPDRYIFLGGFGPAFTQIGNAVPPKLAEAVGRAIVPALDL